MTPTRAPDSNILFWGTPEPSTVEQAAKAAALPFLTGPLALMPDAHVGIGSTIGSVIPTRGAIIPAAVGVDIGCGMAAVELPFTSDLLPDDLTQLHNHITQVVPAGLGKQHAAAQAFFWEFVKQHPTPDLTDKQFDKAAQQLGSLGSGNHFVEVCLDERDRVWVVLHSGSRGIGNELAKVHIDGAKDLMRRYFVTLDDPDLAYLVEGTPQFDAYIRAMTWAQNYARTNRDLMLDAVITQVKGALGHDFEETSRVNCHHNYTEREHHHGQDVWLTRKGAIRARAGDLGIIPGSMATGSYIVRGLGNPASYDSCSHGAGRRLSRGQARRTLTPESLTAAMAGKTWNDRDSQALVDEHPDAYKDITTVMADQADLVAIEHTLTQVLNYKGTDERRRK